MARFGDLCNTFKNGIPRVGFGAVICTSDSSHTVVWATSWIRGRGSEGSEEWGFFNSWHCENCHSLSVCVCVCVCWSLTTIEPERKDEFSRGFRCCDRYGLPCPLLLYTSFADTYMRVMTRRSASNCVFFMNIYVIICSLVSIWGKGNLMTLFDSSRWTA